MTRRLPPTRNTNTRRLGLAAPSWHSLARYGLPVLQERLEEIEGPASRGAEHRARFGCMAPAPVARWDKSVTSKLNHDVTYT